MLRFVCGRRDVFELDQPQPCWSLHMGFGRHHPPATYAVLFYTFQFPDEISSEQAGSIRYSWGMGSLEVPYKQPPGLTPRARISTNSESVVRHDLSHDSDSGVMGDLPPTI